MNNIILKYAIPTATEFTLPLYEGGRVLKVETINEKPYIWVVVPQNAKRIDVTFRVILTGEGFDLPSTYRYVDSFILNYGGFVGHLWMNTAVPVQGEIMK